MSQFSVFHFSARCIFAHFCHFLNQKEHSIQLCSVSRSRFHILPAASPALLAIHAPLLSSPRLLYKFIQYVYYSPAFLNKSHAKSLIQPKREPAPARPREAPPTQAACIRGVRGPARRMESSPAPGSLWFLSPAGKELVRPQTHETPSSSKNNPARVPPPKTKEKRPAHPRQVVLILYPLTAPQPLTAFSCSCTYSVVRIFFTVPSTSSSVVLWLVYASSAMVCTCPFTTNLS